MIRTLRFRINRDKKDTYIEYNRSLNPLYDVSDDPALTRYNGEQMGWFGVESFIISEDAARVTLVTKIFESNCHSVVYDVILTYDELREFFDIKVEGSQFSDTPRAIVNDVPGDTLPDSDVHFLLNSPACEDLRKEAYKRRRVLLEKKAQIEQQLTELNGVL